MMLALELLGGIGLFLLGMSMLTDGLKLAAGDGLRAILRGWTRTPARGLISGALLTGLVQSSSAVTVATIGFVNAGLLTLRHAVWVIFGANVGTTMTAWLVALIGLKLDIGAFALPIIGFGVMAQMLGGKRPRLAGFGQALAGFGLFFLGISVLKGGFETLLPWFESLDLAEAGFFAPFAFLLFGTALAALAQSSSAAIAIILTATAGGGLPLELAGAGIIGANIGTTSTAIFASAGATPAAKRVALAHIVFNFYSGIAAFLLLYPLINASHWLADLILADTQDEPLTLALFNTLLNVFGVILIWPFASRMIDWLQGRYKSEDETIGRPAHLDPTLAAVPALALRGLVLEIERMMNLAFERAAKRLGAEAGHTNGNGDAGILALGQSIRDFIADLSRQSLPSDVVNALPDLIRSIHHVEEAVTEGAAIHDGAQPPATLITGPAWDRLRDGVLATLVTSAGAPDAFKTEFDQEMDEVDQAYQAIKKDLLESTAAGHTSVEAMELALLRARRMRRLAEAALKAERRLCPWAPVASGRVENTPVAQT
ncbi:Na/Pi cotransporter family protein [Hyphomonas neptunium ATCC 15444]|uniref:Na/Pi cotransporter family protein n=2 Tax=Hyphomonas TaxID=85 RepID=Q0C0Z0_HYPNA|nr:MULTISPECIES: Na/Pi symporter [Hyphomonas]ABI76115.1 Na/Pi cotransporter family protein [Hyphomonas neptunium ATCC 15444]KCZ94982.1 Na/Pi cotransporter family protein [Hyphomonas hirschiana VP5]